MSINIKLKIAVGTIAVCSALVLPVSVNGAETSTKAQVTSGSDTLTAAEEAAAEKEASKPAENQVSAADDEDTQTIVLLGEKVSIENPESAKGPFPDLVNFTTSTLGGKVTDLTKHGETIEKTAEALKQAVSAKPDIVIVFTGFSDEKAGTEDAAQQTALKILVSGLKKAGARVFLVPASTTVGAITSANLRLVATDLNATFVPIGTEVGGQPIQDAFNGISAELASPSSKAAEAAAPVSPASDKAVLIRSGKIENPSPAGVEPAVSYDEKKASLQQELNRIAGESGEATLAPITTTTEPGKAYTDTGTTDVRTGYPEGGTLTKRGAEAQESINMRPLPAVKAFRPQIPVPRNQVNKKEPDLSR